MKPEYIGLGNFDMDNYVYAYCRCPLPADHAIKWPRIKDGKPHRYSCICENCGTEVGVISKSYGPEVYKEKGGKEMKVEKEVTICVESFIDALEIVDKMNISLPHAVVFMDEDEFFEGKCRVVIGKTLFMFLPVYKLLKKEEGDDI